MTKEEVFAIMHSDMELWTKAETKQDGDRLFKIINLPFGIGDYTVQFEGVTDAGKRRAAVDQFGALIRAVIDEKISDESVTARAAQQAARLSPIADTGHDRNGDGGTGPETLSDTQTVSTPKKAKSFGEDCADRADDLRGRINEAELNVRKWRVELNALEAAMEVMNASEIQGTQGPSD